jgi:hypothetical protein
LTIVSLLYIFFILSFSTYHYFSSLLQKLFEDTKGVIRSCKSTDRQQNNGQKKTDKRTNNDLKTLHRKVKMEQHKLHLKPGWTRVLHISIKSLTNGNFASFFRLLTDRNTSFEILSYEQSILYYIILVCATRHYFIRRPISMTMHSITKCTVVFYGIMTKFFDHVHGSVVITNMCF